MGTPTRFQGKCEKKKKIETEDMQKSINLHGFEIFTLACAYEHFSVLFLVCGI